MMKVSDYLYMAALVALDEAKASEAQDAYHAWGGDPDETSPEFAAAAEATADFYAPQVKSLRELDTLLGKCTVLESPGSVHLSWDGLDVVLHPGNTTIRAGLVEGRGDNLLEAWEDFQRASI